MTDLRGLPLSTLSVSKWVAGKPHHALSELDNDTSCVL